MEKMLVTGVTKDDSVTRISIVGLEDVPGVAFRLFALLGQNKINVDIILQSIGRDNKKDISFTVASENAKKAVELLKEAYPNSDISVSDNVSKVSIVGSGMQSHAGVAARMFEALYNAGINIHMISTSEIKISVLIDRENSDKAVKFIHDEFIK